MSALRLPFRLLPGLPFRLLPAVLLFSFAMGGCQSVLNHDWRGQGYDDDINGLTENLRAPADEHQMTGLDEKARDIERNLGVR